jgi:hypothetical protein
MASEEKRRIDWTDNLTEKLVDLLQMRECLWKVKEPIYSDRNARQKALAEMSAELNVPGMTSTVHLQLLDPEIDRVGLNDRSEFNSGRLDRSTRLLTGLTIDSTSLNFDRLNRLTRLQLVAALLKQRRSDAR